MNEVINMEPEQNTDDEEPRIPWHFWLIVALGGLYLGFRFIQFLILGLKTIF